MSESFNEKSENELEKWIASEQIKADHQLKLIRSETSVNN